MRCGAIWGPRCWPQRLQGGHPFLIGTDRLRWLRAFRLPRPSLESSRHPSRAGVAAECAPGSPGTAREGRPRPPSGRPRTASGPRPWHRPVCRQAGLDELLPQRRQRPVLHRWRQGQPTQEVAQVVRQRKQFPRRRTRSPPVPPLPILPRLPWPLLPTEAPSRHAGDPWACGYVGMSHPNPATLAGAHRYRATKPMSAVWAFMSNRPEAASPTTRLDCLWHQCGHGREPCPPGPIPRARTLGPARPRSGGGGNEDIPQKDCAAMGRLVRRRRRRGGSGHGPMLRRTQPGFGALKLFP